MVLVVAACSGRTATDPSADAGLRAEPVVIATGLAPPLKFVSDGTRLFLIQGRTGQLATLPARGGALASLLGPNVSLSFLGIDGERVFVVASDGLYALPKNGGPPTKLNTTDRVVKNAAMRGDSLYWADFDRELREGTVKMLENGAERSLATIPFPPQVMVATATTLFLSSPGMRAFPVPGGVPSAGEPGPVDGVRDCQVLVADESAAYCGEGQSSIFKLAMGGAVRLAETYSPIAAAGDASHIYWIDARGSGNYIMRVPKQGGVSETIAKDSATAIAVDDEAIYWDSEGAIKRLLK